MSFFYENKMTKKRSRLGKKRRFSLPPRFVNLEENRDVSFKVEHLSTESRSKILGRKKSGFCKDAHTKVVKKRANESNYSTLKESLKLGIAGATACASAFAAFHIFHSSVFTKSPALTDEIPDFAAAKAAGAALNEEISLLSKLKFASFSKRKAPSPKIEAASRANKIAVRKIESEEELVNPFVTIKGAQPKIAAQKEQVQPQQVQKLSTQSKSLISTKAIEPAQIRAEAPKVHQQVIFDSVESIERIDAFHAKRDFSSWQRAVVQERSRKKVSIHAENSLTVVDPKVEAKKMRNLHRMMRHRFYLAVNTQIEDRIKIAKLAPIRAVRPKEAARVVKKVTNQKVHKAKKRVSTHVAKRESVRPKVLEDDFQINWTKPNDQKIVVTKIEGQTPKNLVIPRDSTKMNTHLKPPSGLFAQTANQMWKSMSTQKFEPPPNMKVDREKKRIEILPTKKVEANLSSHQPSIEKVKPKMESSTKSAEPLQSLSTQESGNALSSIFVEGSLAKYGDYPKVSIHKLPLKEELVQPIEQYAQNAIGPQNKDEYPYFEYSPVPTPPKKRQPIEITKIEVQPEPEITKIEPTIEEPVEVAEVLPEEPLLAVADLPMPDVPTTDIVEVSESEPAVVAEYSQPQAPAQKEVDLQAWFQPGYRYAEAFDSSTAVATVNSEKLSLESIPTTDDSTGLIENTGKGGAWIVSSAPDHVSTLAWHPQTATREEVTIPLISKNSNLILAARMKTKIQDKAGMVFGHLPRDWTFDTSFAPTDMLLFDVNGKKLEDRDPHARFDARTFVIANVKPGAHVIYLSQLRNGDSRNVIRDGAVGFPVMEGKVTYLDLREVRDVKAAGTVYASSAAKLGGIKNVHVKTLAQRDQGTFTNEVGRYHFQKVTLFGDYPVIVEAQTSGGFRHRYQMSPGQFQNAKLFYFDDSQVGEWIGQLDGGLSPESGMVITALPGIAEKLNYEPVFPSIQTLAQDPSLEPETYTLSPEGQLMVETALAENSPRFVSVQVPEGPAIAKIFDRTGRQAGSWLVYSSPGVINVLLNQ